MLADVVGLDRFQSSGADVAGELAAELGVDGAVLS